MSPDSGAVRTVPTRGPAAWRRNLEVNERDIARLERQALLTSRRDEAWDREAATQDLGISRATIYRKRKRFGICAPAVHGRRQTGVDSR